MKLKHKPDFETARNRWDMLWRHEIDKRPCTLVTATRKEKTEPYPLIVPENADFKNVLAAADDYLESLAFLGEAMPAVRPGFGPDQMAGFLGAPLVMSTTGRPTSWSKKIVTDWDSFLPLNINAENRYFQRMKQFHKLAEEHLREKCLLGEIDMHSNIDLLEGLRGAENLLYDMIDNPETVLEAMSDARKIFKKVHSEFYAFGDKETLGTTCLLPMYDRGKYNRIQADFIALLSPDMFRKFVLPAIEEEAHYLDRSCFHLDGPDALKHLDDILAINSLDAIQWVSGAGNKPQIEWPEVLHRIQEAGKIIILHISPSEVKQVHRQYAPELVVYDVKTDSIQEGLDLLEWLTANT